MCLITSVCAYLDLTGKQYDHLREAIAVIIKIADKHDIGYQSILSSKVAATSFEVFRRHGLPITTDLVAQKCGVRPYTITRFVNELHTYHSYFESTYKSFGIDSSFVAPAKKTTKNKNIKKNKKQEKTAPF